MMRGRALLLGSCLLSLGSAFLVPLPRKPLTRVFSTLEREAPEEPELGENITWDTKKQHKVDEGDWFVMDKRIEDYSALSKEERDALAEQALEVDTQVSYQPFVSTDHPFAWARNLNTIVAVPDPSRVSKFYQEAFGLTQVRDLKTASSYSATLAYGSEEFGQFPGLTFVQGSGDKGDGYLGATIIVDDLSATLSKVKSAGGKVVSDKKEYNYPACAIPEEPAGTVNKEVKATVEDPAGFRVTVIEGHSDDKLSSVTLRVPDMERAVSFYNQLGMKILKMRSYEPHEQAASTWVGYDDDHIYCMGFVHEKMKEANYHMFRTPRFSLELKQEFSSSSVRPGTAQFSVGVESVDAAISHLKSVGAKVVSQPTEVNHVVTAVVEDAHGYKIALTEMESFNQSLE